MLDATSRHTSCCSLQLPRTCTNIDRSDLVDVLDKYKQPKNLGSGAHGKVRLMKLVAAGRMCAVKIPREELEEEVISDIIQKEVSILTSLHGLDCIPQLFGVSKTETGVPLIVQEFIGDPFDFKSTTLDLAIHTDIMTKSKALRIALTLVEAVMDIHSRRVLHCDLKVDNVMLMPGYLKENHPKIKIIDFGGAVYIDETPWYEDVDQSEQQEMLQRCIHIAPEVVKGEMPYGIQSEVFALGVIFIEMSGRLGGFLRQLGRECVMNDYRKRPRMEDILAKIENHVKDKRLGWLGLCI